jgi:hypothetical protein
MAMNLGDRVPLRCGHQGRVVWISEDATTIAVKGTQRSCPTCYKNNKNPTVYLITT